MSEKLKANGALNSNFELEIPNQDSHFTYFYPFLIYIDSTFRDTQ